MKRLTSIDFLRGIAIFFTLVFHFLFTNWDAFAGASIPEIIEYGGIPFLIFSILIVILIHWRGFFLMISAVVNFYSMERALKKGKNVFVIWTKQIIAGIVLILIGKLWVTFMPYWGTIEEWSRNQYPTLAASFEANKSMFYMIEAIESIGLMMIVTSFLFLIFAIRKLRDKWLIKTIISFVLGILVIVLTPIVQTAMANALGIDLSVSENFSKFQTWNIWEKIWRIPLNWLVGREAPLFPMLGSYYFGAGLGEMLSQDQPKKKQFQWIYLIGGILTVWGLIDFLVLSGGLNNFDPGFHVHYRWFAIFSAGLQMIVIVAAVIKIEFNRKLRQEKWLYGTRWMRRFGVFALTAYFFSIADMFIRFLFAAIIPSMDFYSRYSLGTGMTFLLCVILMSGWHVVLCVWDRFGRGYLTWEFFVSLLRRPKGGHKRDWKDPVNLKGILWDVEAISYVTPYTDEQYKQIVAIEDKKKELRLIKAPWLYFKFDWNGKFYPIELFLNFCIVTIRGILLSPVYLIQRIKYSKEFKAIKVEVKQLTSTF